MKKNENFIGLLSLRKLLISDNKNISSIVNKKNLISVKVNETKESIINLMNKYNLVVLPVLNNKNELIGRITLMMYYPHLKRKLIKTIKWLQNYLKI